MKLKEKVAVITGGASGMGLATVNRYLEEGARVVIADFNADTGETAKELTGDFYGEWQGTRHFDGEEILNAHIAREIEIRRLYFTNWPGARLGEMACQPCKLGDWGEYRIVTSAVKQ